MYDKGLPVRQNHEFLVIVDRRIRKGAFRCDIVLRHCFSTRVINLSKEVELLSWLSLVNEPALADVESG